MVRFALGAAAAGAAGAAATRTAVRRWGGQHDPLGGVALHLPDGDHTLVETSDGAKLEVTVAGDGERTFVLAHCWTGDRRVWGHVAQRLVDRGHRVVLYDHRGHGGSTVGTDRITLSVLARDLAEVLDHTGARDVTLAGHSMGGMTVQTYAIEHAEHRRDRVAALGLVATACARLSRGRVADEVAVRVVGRVGPGERWMRSHHGGALSTRRTFGRGPVLAHLHAARDTYLATSASVRGSCLGTMLAMDLRPGLPGLDVPAVVIAGELDALVPLHHSREIAAHLPGARMEVLDGAGHMLPFERADAVADLLERAAG